MNNALKHLEYVMIGLGGVEVKGRLCFLTYSDTRVGGTIVMGETLDILTVHKVGLEIHLGRGSLETWYRW